MLEVDARREDWILCHPILNDGECILSLFLSVTGSYYEVMAS